MNMAKGNGSDYENLEDDENVNENYCEAVEELADSVVGGDGEGNFDEYSETGDEEYLLSLIHI